MKRLITNTASAMIGLALSAVCLSSQAQGSAAAAASQPLTRAQVKMERQEFLRSHSWDPVNEVWTVKPGFEAPAGVKSRAEMKAERDEFLRNNRWDVATRSWVPIKGGPRKLDTLTRAEVKKDTQAFLRTHRFDEELGQWVETHPAKSSQ